MSDITNAITNFYIVGALFAIALISLGIAAKNRENKK